MKNICLSILMASFLAACIDDKKPETTETTTPTTETKPETTASEPEKTEAEKAAEKQKIDEAIKKETSPIKQIAARNFLTVNPLGTVAYKNRSLGLSTRIGAVKGMLRSKNDTDKNDLAAVMKFLFPDDKFREEFNQALQGDNKNAKQQATEILADLMYVLSISPSDYSKMKKDINVSFAKIMENANMLNKINNSFMDDLKKNLKESKISLIKNDLSGKGAENIDALFN